MKCEGHVERMGDGRDAYKVSVERANEWSPIGRPKRRCEDNIKMDLQKVGCGGLDWIALTEDGRQVMGCCECGNEPPSSQKYREFLDQLRNN